jgi:6-phosphogluconolactonase/glucosamine-6-phosphate isomerase/deaminase
MAKSHEPDIHTFADGLQASEAMAQAVVDVLKITPAGQTILLATGKTMLDFYPALIRLAQSQSVDLASFNYAHLDTYVWRPSLYPNGPGKEDFITYLKENFLGPANIPADRFFPMNGVTDTPEIEAKRYDDWLTQQSIAVVFLGLGPPPEVHLAYMNAGTPLETGVHFSTLSDVTVTRNKNRGEMAPTEAITVGLSNLRHATHKFVLAINKPEEVRLAFTGPITTDIVATALRTQGFGESVHVYVDGVSQHVYLTRHPSISKNDNISTIVFI